MSENELAGTAERQTRTALIRLAVRVTVYYSILFLVLYMLVSAMPGMRDILPVGGIDDVTGQDPAIAELNAALLRGDTGLAKQLAAAETAKGGRWDDALRLLLAMTSTILLMLPVSWLYQCIHGVGEQDHSLDETALILPTVVAGIVTVVQHSLALAFSLAGIVAGVRFRRTLSDTFDTLFIFVAIGVGIAAGVGAIEIAAVMTLFFNYATIGICLFGDGLETQHVAARRQRRRKRKQAMAGKPGDD
ncbi:MAG: DUF4956 domain-containing protein [Woeseiaceae bacterium]